MDALHRAQHWSLQHQSYSWQEFRTYKLTKPCRQSRPDVFQPQLEGGRAYIWSRWKGLWLKLNWLFIGLLWCVCAICFMHRAGILPDHFSVNPSHLAPSQRAKKSSILFHPTNKNIFVLEISLCLGYALLEERHSLTINRSVSLQGMRHIQHDFRGWWVSPSGIRIPWWGIGHAFVQTALLWWVLCQIMSALEAGGFVQLVRGWGKLGAGVTYSPFSFLWPLKEAAERWMMPTSCACHFQSGMGMVNSWWMSRKEGEGGMRGSKSVLRHDRSAVDEAASPWCLQEICIIRGWWML